MKVVILGLIAICLCSFHTQAEFFKENLLGKKTMSSYFPIENNRLKVFEIKEGRKDFIATSLYSTSHSKRTQEENRTGVFGVMVGLGYGKLKSNDLADPDFHFKPFYSKIAGVTLDVPMPNLEKRGSFFNELSFSQFEAATNDRYPDTTGGFPDRDYYQIERKFAPNMITLTNTFRYCFTNGDLKYYVSVGVYNNFIIEAVNRRVTEHYVNGEVTSNSEELVPDHAIHGIMLTAGTGITYKYAGLEFRYDPGRNFTRKVDYSIYSPVVSVLLHVRFNP